MHHCSIAIGTRARGLRLGARDWGSGFASRSAGKPLAEFRPGHGRLLPCLHILDCDDSAGAFVAAHDRDTRNTRGGGILELLSELVRLGIHLDADATRRAARAPVAARRWPLRLRTRSRARQRPPRHRTRKHPALGHHHQNALEAEREAAGGNVLAQKHPNQAIIPATATETAGEIGHGDLHDRAGVVRQAARQARVEAQVRRGTCRGAQRDDSLQLLDGREPRSRPDRDQAFCTLIQRRTRTRRSTTALAGCRGNPPLDQLARTPSPPILSSLSSATSA